MTSGTSLHCPGPRLSHLFRGLPEGSLLEYTLSWTACWGLPRSRAGLTPVSWALHWKAVPLSSRLLPVHPPSGSPEAQPSPLGLLRPEPSRARVPCDLQLRGGGGVGSPGRVSAPSSSSASCRWGWGCTASGPWSSSVWGLQEELLSGRGQLCVDRVSTGPSLPALGSPRREVGLGAELCWP